MKTEIIDDVRKQLAQSANESAKEGMKRFFKEEIKLYGLKSAQIGRIGKQAFKAIENSPKTEILELCEELWKSGMIEEAFIACNWAYYIHPRLDPDDFLRLEAWVYQYISNWATCDSLCTGTISSFIMRYPAFIQKIKNWTQSEGRWVKRASAVSFIIPARKGQFKQQIFEIADLLLLDPDDMVRKGYGWMLKSLAEAYEDEVFNFVMERRNIMPRTALRYAIEKMPEHKRQQAMKKA